jgi:hypothetical protein
MSRFLSKFDVIKRLPWERIRSLGHAHNTGVTAYLQTFGKPCSSMHSRHPSKRTLFVLVLTSFQLEVQKLNKCNRNTAEALHLHNVIQYCSELHGGPDCVVFIATGYGLDGPGIETRWGLDFPHLSRPALGTTQPPVQWVPGLIPGVKSGRGVLLTPHPF